MNESCATCRFWKDTRFQAGSVNDRGECWRYPPTGSVSGFTKPDDCCGEYQPKEHLEIKPDESPSQ